MILEITEEWPADLPLPMVDYSGSPVNMTMVSPPNLIASLRRSRFERTYNTVNVSWCLSLAQYAQLKSFYEDDLGNGCSQFKMEVRFPKNSELTTWAVLFMGGLSAAHEDGLWKVQAVLRLVNPVEF